MMAIRFQCKECDAQFSVKEELSGKSAKCPKCKTVIQVPSPDMEVSKVDASTKEEAVEEETQENEDTIVFLCPNGHELHGPSQLQGKPGKCPHCGSKFQIPFYGDDEESEEFPEEEIPHGKVVTEGSIGLPDSPGTVPFPEAEVLSEEDIVLFEEEATLPPPLPGEVHALATHFTWLWNQREHAADLTIHFKNGDEAFRPSLFALRRSQGPYGLFAVEESDGTFTITTLAWDEVSRIVLSKAEDIDDDAFDLA